MAEGLRLLIRTPHETVLDAPVRSARIATETGLSGVRPRAEPFVSVVEPGLLVLSMPDGSMRFAASAGGLLDCDRERCALYTPFAVLGDDDAQVLAALDRVLSTPDTELVTRQRLGELEQRIARELRQPRPARHRSGRG